MHDQAATAPDGAMIEWAHFRLADGAEESALLAASEALQRDFLQRQPGFVRRELLRGADGRWADFVVWRDEASAAAALRAVESSAACHAYFRLMQAPADPDGTHGVVHLARVRVY